MRRIGMAYVSGVQTVLHTGKLNATKPWSVQRPRDFANGHGPEWSVQRE